MAIASFDKDVEVIQKLDDEPNDVQGLTPEELKQRFDQAAVWIKEYINTVLLPGITGTGSGGGASNIGAGVDDFPGSDVQAVLNAFNDALTDRYTRSETNSYVGQETHDLVKTVGVNLTTGVITVTKKDGTSETFDTALEKVPATMALVEKEGGTYLVITNQDGSETQTDVSALIDTYSFNNSTEIAFSMGGSGNNRTVTASIRANSIGLDKFTLEVTQALEQYNAESAASAQDAADSAEAAAGSAAAALSSQNAAAGSASTASQRAAAAEDSAASAAGSAGAAAASAQSAQSSAAQALESRDAAQAAQQAIEDMTVSSSTLGPGSQATVTRTEQNGVVNLAFGIPQGIQGPQGPAGPAGGGVPSGGTTGQMLVKASDEDYETQWADGAAGGGVTSFKGRTGAVQPQDGDYTAQQVEALSIYGGDLSSNGMHVYPYINFETQGIRYDPFTETLTCVEAASIEDISPSYAPFGCAAPTKDSHAATKGYVDTAIQAAGTGIPAGGTTGQVLAKKSNVDYDARWVNSIPAGGTTGQVLAKASAADYNTHWVNAPNTFPTLSVGSLYFYNPQEISDPTLLVSYSYSNWLFTLSFVGQQETGFPVLLRGVATPVQWDDAVNKQYVDNAASASGKRTARLTVGTSQAGWTEASCDYLCDGTKDQVEINAAIQALPEGGGEIVILDGTYHIGGSIDVNKSRITLRGNGQSTILKREAPLQYMVNITAPDNTVTELCFDGNSESYPFPCNGIRVWDNGNKTSNHTIAYNRFINSGMSLDVDQSTITGNTCTGNLANGIQLSGDNNIVTGNSCTENDGSGIQLLGNRNIVTSNICTGNGTNGIYLKRLSSASDSTYNIVACNNAAGSNVTDEGTMNTCELNIVG